MSAHGGQHARAQEPTRKRPASARDQGEGDFGGDQFDETSDRHADHHDGQSGETPSVPHLPRKKQKKTQDPGDGGKVHLTLVNEEHDYRRGPSTHCPEIYDQIQKARKAGIGVGVNDAVVIKYEPPEGRGITPPPLPPAAAVAGAAPATTKEEEQSKAKAERAAHAAETSVPEASGGLDDMRMQPAVTEADPQPDSTAEQVIVAEDAVLEPETAVTKVLRDGSEPMQPAVTLTEEQSALTTEPEVVAKDAVLEPQADIIETSKEQSAQTAEHAVLANDAVLESQTDITETFKDRSEPMQPAVTLAEEQSAQTAEQTVVAADAVLEHQTDIAETSKDRSEPMSLQGASESSVRQTPQAPAHSALTGSWSAAPQHAGEQPNIGRQMVESHGEDLQQQIPQQHTQPPGGNEQVGGAQGLPPRMPRRGDADIKRIGRKRLQIAFPDLGPFRRIRTWAGPHISAPSIRRTSVADKLPPHPGFSRPGRRRGPRPTDSGSGNLKQEAPGPQDVPLQSIEEAPPQTETRGDEAALSKRGRGRPRGRKTTEPRGAEASSVTQPGPSTQQDSRQPSVASSVATRRSTRNASVASTRAPSAETGRPKITRKGRAATTTTTKASSRGPPQLETVAEEGEEEEGGDDPKIKIEEDEHEYEWARDDDGGLESKGSKKEPAAKKQGASKGKAAAGKASGNKKSSTKAATKKSAKKR